MSMEKIMDNQGKPLSIADAAAYTGYQKSYLYKLIHLKKLTCYKPNGGRVYFKKEDLDFWVFSNRSKAEAELSDVADLILNRNRFHFK